MARSQLLSLALVALVKPEVSIITAHEHTSDNSTMTCSLSETNEVKGAAMCVLSTNY